MSFQCPNPEELPGIGSHFAPLSDAARIELADLRGFMADLVARFQPAHQLSRTVEDFAVLQRLCDEDAMAQANHGAWVAVGVAFGDALMRHIPGLSWQMTSDQYGAHAVLRFQDTGLSIAAPTMLWKRIERGQGIDIVHLASELRRMVEANGT